MPSKYLIRDAREIGEVITKPTADVIITSPPYFDLKNYGSTQGQIGYKQKYSEYLNDITAVFEQCAKAAKKNSTLWMIIDSFKKSGEYFTLPFDIKERLKKVGWQLHEVIIWKKDKTLPYTARGEMRNIFEYILFFKKNNKFKFNADRVKNVDNLKEWWKKYPERYNPSGKMPDNVWEFPIPTQGSWGKKYLRHFCPLPTQLIERIILLSTDEGDTVMDPFAGSGSVLAQAHFMNRKYLGFDINSSYKKLFLKYLQNEKTTGRARYKTLKRSQNETKKFKNIILNLRQLKFPKLLFQSIYTSKEAYLLKNIVGIFVITKSIDQNKLACAYSIVCNGRVEKKKLSKLIESLASKPPLSKFGIAPKFAVYESIEAFQKTRTLRAFNNTMMYIYTHKNTHHYSQYVSLDRALDMLRKKVKRSTTDYFIISPIKVNVL